MAEPARVPATYADLERVPPHLVAELIHGVLETHPRPVPRHAIAVNSLSDEITAPFQKGPGGPGGWIFMIEPELHFGENVLVPDLAGWRRERLPALPDTPFLTVAPDWACEVLSPSTEHLDRGPKRRIYPEAGVAFLWLLDPRIRLLEAFVLTDGRWTLLAGLRDAEEVSVPPFEAISFSLGSLFPFDDPTQPPPAP